MAKRKSTKTVETLRHQDASRKNIPTAEYQAVMAEDDRNPIEVAYERRNRDLDPQLVCAGRMSRTGRIWWCKRRRCSFRRRCIRRC